MNLHEWVAHRNVEGARGAELLLWWFWGADADAGAVVGGADELDAGGLEDKDYLLQVAAAIGGNARFVFVPDKRTHRDTTLL